MSEDGREALIPVAERLRGELRDWIARTLDPHGAEYERGGAVPREVFRSFAVEGFLALAYPKEVGGGGQGFLEQLVVAEELYYTGWGGVSLSLLGHAGIALQPLFKLGTAQQRERFLIPALEGRSLTALAVTEPDAGSDVGSLTTTAVRTGDGWRLDGRKVFVTIGTQADCVIVVARTADEPGANGLSLFLVPGDTPGFTVVRSMEKLGMHSSDTAELRMTNCLVLEDALLGPEGRGFRAVMQQFQAERLILAAGALAMARRALDEAVSRLRDRVQFGRPLASFQALQHRVADAAAMLTALRSFVFATAREYDAGEYPVTEISMAKLVCARASCDIVDDMLQMFGGWGYVTDFPIERIWRDVRLMRIGGGTDEIMREVIAKRIGMVPPDQGHDNAPTSPRAPLQTTTTPGR